MIYFIFISKLSVNCEWGEWRVGLCSKTCGKGERTNHRYPLVKAAFGGEICSGPSDVTEECKNQECPGRIFAKYYFFLKIRLVSLMNKIYKYISSRLCMGWLGSIWMLQRLWWGNQIKDKSSSQERCIWWTRVHGSIEYYRILQHTRMSRFYHSLWNFYIKNWNENYPFIIIRSIFLLSFIFNSSWLWMGRMEDRHLLKRMWWRK